MRSSHTLLFNGHWGTSLGLKRPGGEVNLSLLFSNHTLRMSGNICVHGVEKEPYC